MVLLFGIVEFISQNAVKMNNSSSKEEINFDRNLLYNKPIQNILLIRWGKNPKVNQFKKCQ